MNIYDNSKYVSEIKKFSNLIDLSFLNGKTIFVAGASGLIGSYFIDTILANKKQNTVILALVYTERDLLRFTEDPRLILIKGDVRDAEVFKSIDTKIDFVINAASIVDPKGYKEHPIDTMTINIYGTKNLLDLCVKNRAKFLLLSSCEIYGESDCELIDENYCGKLDSMDVRSCYNESKRTCETLSVSYGVEKNIDVRVARLSRSFGPTQSPFDTKALSQFIKNGILGENIILKSSGTQLFSYTYVQDIVSGLITILKSGKSLNAYNVSNEEKLHLKDVANIVAIHSGTSVVFDLNKDEFSSGYSKASLAIQSPKKLKQLGWVPRISLKDGICNTMDILKELYY